MQKFYILSAFCLFVNISIGQLKSPVKELFYGINLSAPRNEIYDQLCSDKRFYQKGYIETDSMSPFYHGEFHGLCFDKGLVENRADSVEISLNWLKISKPMKNGKFQTINNLIFVVRNYYPSIDIARKEYQRIIDLLIKNKFDTSNQENFIHFPIPIESKSFNFRKPTYHLEIALYSVDYIHSELHFKFIRKE
jgi:hypothetical protein